MHDFVKTKSCSSKSIFIDHGITSFGVLSNPQLGSTLSASISVCTTHWCPNGPNRSRLCASRSSLGVETCATQELICLFDEFFLMGLWHKYLGGWKQPHTSLRKASCVDNRSQSNNRLGAMPHGFPLSFQSMFCLLCETKFAKFITHFYFLRTRVTTTLND